MKSAKLSSRIALSVTAFLFTFSALISINKAHSQETLSVEGVLGDIDDGRRSPIITYSTEVAADKSSAKILVDTQVINEEFKKFPIVMDFFVNGKLFSRQFRSVELPAPLGIDVPKELAEIPFNYSIVATVIHPNRQYTSMAQGAITADQISSKLSCTLNRTSDSLSIEGEVSNTLNDDNQLEVSFGTTQSAALDLEFTTSSSTTTSEVSGSVKITEDEGTETTVKLNGTSEVSGKTVSSIEIESEDSDISVLCETAELIAEDTQNSAVNTEASSVEGLESAINSDSGLSKTESNSNYGPNFIPLDQVGGVEVVN